MVVRVMGGYDPATGWPVDDSTGVQFNPDVDIPGTFRGGGQGFGPGGFPDSPKLTAPASGPAPGISLSGPGGGGAPASGGPDVVPPTNTPLRPGVSPAIRTGPGPATDATINPGGGGGLFSRLRGFLPSILGGPAIVPALAVGGAAAGYKFGEPGREKLSVDPRIDAASSSGYDVGQPLGPPDSRDAPTVAPSAPYRPEDDPRYTVAPSAPYRPEDDPRFTAPNPYGAGMPRGTGSPAPAAPPPRPRVPLAAGPAAVAQQPNLGAYSPFTTIDRPNASATGWNPGAPKATALDLSRLFGGGGQPAQVVAAPTPVYKNPSIRQVFPTTPLGQGGIGSDARFPLKKPKSSSSSQRGGY
jgi:hypothetical protein